MEPSFLITLGFLLFVLGGSVYPEVLEGEPAWLHWTLAAVSGGFFFASIVIHEMAHSLVARRYDIPVRAITMFMLGGVSQITKDPRRPMHEFLIAIVGPLTSLVLAAVFLGLALTPGLSESRAGVMWEWLFVMNVSLGVVNLAPGFPLDGGRVLRSVLWAVTGSHARATRWAALGGRGLGVALIGAGVLALVDVIPGIDPVSGVWFIFVGLFLENAARQSWQQESLLDLLRPHTVREIMTEPKPALPGDMTVKEAVERHMQPERRPFAFVMVEGSVAGMFGSREFLELMRRGARAHWPPQTLAQAMRPAEALVTVSPDADLAGVVELMDSARQMEVPVLDGGRLIGCADRRSITSLINRLQGRRGPEAPGLEK